jgi:hypothetical protein
MNPSPKRMRVFHRTDPEAAADIRIMGFYDSTDIEIGRPPAYGVLVSNQPLDIEGADGHTLLTLKIPIELFERFEWQTEGQGYREALIPADELNQHGQPRIVRQDAADRWTTIRHRANRGGRE